MYYRPDQHGEMTVDEVVEDITGKVIKARELVIEGEIEMLRWGLRKEVELERKPKDKKPGLAAPKTDDGQGLPKDQKADDGQQTSDNSGK